MASTDTASKESTGLDRLRDLASRNPATERLLQEAEGYVGAHVHHLVTRAGDRLGQAAGKVTDSASGTGTGALIEGGKRLAGGASPMSAAAGAGLSGLKDTVKKAFGKGSGRGRRASGGKVMSIVEDIDIGVPVAEAYNQWTQFQEFSGFTKGVKSVETTDDTTSNWTMKIFWSTRSWKGTVVEQVPEERIVWTTEGAKGTTKGVVTFHRIDERLTKVLLVLEYHPKGLFEKTANVWRAQGRRARLDLKHFRRFVMMRGEATGGWRGEIRDGDVVEDHESAVEREEHEAEQSAGREEDENFREDSSAGEDEAEDGEGYEDEVAEDDDALPEDEDEAEAYDEDEAYDDEEAADPEDGYEPEDEQDVEEDEPEPEHAGRR